MGTIVSWELIIDWWTDKIKQIIPLQCDKGYEMERTGSLTRYIYYGDEGTDKGYQQELRLS